MGKVSPAKIKANKKWIKNNTYTKTIVLYNKTFPKEDFEKFKLKCKEKGISQNQFLTDKMRELISEKEE